MVPVLYITSLELTHLTAAGSLCLWTTFTQLKYSFYSCILSSFYRRRCWVTEKLSHLARVTELGGGRAGIQVQLWLPTVHSSPHVLFVANPFLPLCIKISQNRRKIRETRPARGWSDIWRESKDWVLWKSSSIKVSQRYYKMIWKLKTWFPVLLFLIFSIKTLLHASLYRWIVLSGPVLIMWHVTSVNWRQGLLSFVACNVSC